MVKRHCEHPPQRSVPLVRVPTDALDGLVLDLRRELGKDGELKGLKIGSQDITKQYYDLESRLKAAKTMQERLLKIIADGKGEIKQLLEAENAVQTSAIDELAAAIEAGVAITASEPEGEQGARSGNAQDLRQLVVPGRPVHHAMREPGITPP